MSGHSKWSTIKHKKGRADAQRGKLFTKLIRDITTAARSGGGDLNANHSLRTAVQKAKEANMPNDTVKKAILRGTGELAGGNYEEITYEGYGPKGVAIMVELVTDNRNRTAAEMRNIFSKRGGSLGESGCVAWMFSQKGQIIINKEKIDEGALMDIVLEAGAEDINDEDGFFDVLTPPDRFSVVKEALENAGVEYEMAEVSRIPQNTVDVSGADARKILRLLEALEEHEDVQNVFSNFDTQDNLD